MNTLFLIIVDFNISFLRTVYHNNYFQVLQIYWSWNYHSEFFEQKDCCLWVTRWVFFNATLILILSIIISLLIVFKFRCEFLRDFLLVVFNKRPMRYDVKSRFGENSLSKLKVYIILRDPFDHSDHPWIARARSTSESNLKKFIL